MRTLLRFFVLLTLALGLGHAAEASHALGGSITYTSLGGNQYRVQVEFFRDCSGIPAPTSFTLQTRNVCGGAVGPTATLTQVGQPFIGNPYSSFLQGMAPCPLNAAAPTGSLTNFAAFRYEATVTLVPGNWILAVEEGSRPLLTNISAGTLRLEATLNNTTQANSSARFSNLPIFFVSAFQDNLLHLGAFDADGDSLSFQLARPLNGCGVYETYSTYPWNCRSSVISTNPSCLLSCTTPTYYSAKLPIAVKVDTLGSCPIKMGIPRFAFDSLSGALAFHPNRYLASSSSSINGDNKNAVVVKVTEWRKLNGVYTVVGTTRRDMVWVAFPGNSGGTPRLTPTVTVQSGTRTTTQARTAPIAVRVGEPISVSFTATSALANNPLTYTLEQNTVPGAVIQNSTTAGQATLTFTPALNLRDGLYYVSLTVKDDASPLRNVTTVPVAFRVYSGTLANKASRSQAALTAYPNPFSERVQFQLENKGVQELMVYNQLGQVVARLQSQADGQVQWQPGAELPAGLYLARTQDGSQSVRLLRTELR